MKTEILKPSDKQTNNFNDTIGSHKDKLLSMNLMKGPEIDLVIDSVLGDQNMLVELLGKEVYEQIKKTKPDIFSQKKLTNKNDHNNFDEFKDNYIKQQQAKYINEQKALNQEKTKGDIKNKLNKKIEEDKTIIDRLNSINKAKSALQILKDKSYTKNSFLSSIVKIDQSMLPIAEDLVDFFVEYKSPYEKNKFNKFKKKNSKKSSFDFLKENGEPQINEIISLINLNDQKIGSKISGTKQKLINNFEVKTNEINISKKRIESREKDAKEKYNDYIKQGNQNLYSEAEIIEGNRVKDYIAKQLSENTCPSFDPNKLMPDKLTSEKDLRQGGRTAIKGKNGICVDKGLIIQKAANIRKLAEHFIDEERNIRDYILNRIAEYFAMEIIPYTLSKEAKDIDNISIMKTSIEDDTFGGADFVVRGQTKDGIEEEWIDLTISNKSNKIDQKIEEAKKKSFLIDSFLNDVVDNGEKQTGYENTKEIIAFDPVTFYSLFAEFMHNLKEYGKIFGPKHRNISEFFESALNNHHSNVGELYKIAYKAVYDRMPRGEISTELKKFTNKYGHELFDNLN